MLPPAGAVLELASGTGQHAAHFSGGLPALEWQPSDVTPELFPSIAAHTRGRSNVRPPLVLDAAWPPPRWAEALGGAAGFDALFVANMTHIAPWEATLGLLAGAGALLRPGGVLALYGPFGLGGVFTTESNRAFHERLVARRVGSAPGAAAARARPGRGQGMRARAAVPARWQVFRRKQAHSLGRAAPRSTTHAHTHTTRLQTLCHRSPPRRSNPAWGYRDTDAIEAAARAHGLEQAAIEAMPANNFMLVFTKAGGR